MRASRGRVSGVKLAHWFAVALLGAHVLTACERPKPPTLTPEKGEVTSVGPDGIHLTLYLGVENPNKFDLSARSVTGRVLLDGKYDLGNVSVTQPFRLPSGQVTRLAVPMTVALKDVPLVVGLALSNRDLSYDVDGSVNVGGEKINVDLPFRLSGELTHEQLLKATVNSLPRLP
jgi:LEA14-like dessication related protein